jgi:hypothetical protein
VFSNSVVVVWKLDRLSRKLKHMLETVEMLHERRHSSGRSKRKTSTISQIRLKPKADPRYGRRSIPFALITGVAAGARRKLIKAFAASASLAPALTPAVYIV